MPWEGPEPEKDPEITWPVLGKGFALLGLRLGLFVLGTYIGYRFAGPLGMAFFCFGQIARDADRQLRDEIPKPLRKNWKD